MAEDETDTAPPADEAEGTAAEEQPKGEGSSEGTLVPKELFPGKDLAVGQTVTMEVAHIYEDEVLLKPVGKPETATGKPKTPNDELDELDEGGY